MSIGGALEELWRRIGGLEEDWRTGEDRSRVGAGLENDPRRVDVPIGVR